MKTIFKIMLAGIVGIVGIVGIAGIVGLVVAWIGYQVLNLEQVVTTVMAVVATLMVYVACEKIQIKPSTHK